MTIPCRGLLFDLDGTLIDSLPAVDRAWTAWSHRVGLDPAAVLPVIHGRRSIDSVRDLAPHLDAEAEDAWLRARECADTEGVIVLPGARELLASLPEGTWAVVTSGTRDVATARLRAVGIEPPPASVFGDEVAIGKPDPAPFLLGASRLGFSPRECVAFEDAPAGLASAVASGCVVVSVGVHAPGIAVRTTTDRIRVHADPLRVEVV